MSDAALVFSILYKASGAEDAFGESSQIAGDAGAMAGEMFMAQLSQAMENENANAIMAAQLGDNMFAADAGKAAGELYAGAYGESLTEVNQAVAAVTQSGILAEDDGAAAIENLTAKAMSLSKVFGVDVTDTAKAAAQMVKTGLAKNSEEAFDIITAGFQSTGVTASGDALDTINEYSVQFQKLGIDGETAFGAITQGLNAGARDTDIVADMFKEFSLRSIADSKDLRASYKALGMDAESSMQKLASGGPEATKTMDAVMDKLRAMKDPVERNALAVKFFGTQYEDMGAAALAIDLSSASKQLGDVAGAAGELDKTVGDTASNTLTKLGRQVQDVLMDKMAAAVPYLSAAGEWLMKYESIITPIVTVLGALAAVIAVINVATTIWTAVQAAFNVTLWGCPVVWIIAAVIVLVAVIVLLWKNWDSVTAWMSKAWNWLKNGIISGIKSVGSWFGSVFDWIGKKMSAFIGFFTSLPGRMLKTGRGMFNWMYDAFRGVVNKVIGLWNRLDFGFSVGPFPDWIPGVGGKRFSVPDMIPDLPYLYTGGTIASGGWAVVGERGPEVTWLPTGAQVWPNRGTAPSAGGDVVVRIDTAGTRLDQVLADIIRSSVRGGGGQTDRRLTVRAGR